MKPVRTLLCLLCLATPLQASAMEEPAFRQCVADLQQRAVKKGIAPELAARELAAVQFLPDVIEKDRFQPEFTDGFAAYFNRRITDARIARGRAMLTEHAAVLARAGHEYGVPANVLVSFWGLETNYGSFMGEHRTLDALATLACEGRRADYFGGELLNALRIVQAGDASGDTLRGSWAGALGHVQFMPYNILRHAVDADGDGRRDIRGSVPDALLSAAAFLKALGWQRDARWGEEVLLPEGFDYLLAGSEKSATRWRKLDVQTAAGDKLPKDDEERRLLLPTGHAGPAFLVGPNFRVIMRWNRSEAYALTVGHLADRLAGAGALVRAPVAAPRLAREQVMQLQQALNDAGSDAGTPDGVPGPATRRAIADWQRRQGLVPDGFAGQQVLEKLGIIAPAVPPAPATPVSPGTTP